MNRDVLKGKWRQVQGDIKAKWGKLTDNHLTEIGGDWDKLTGRLQEEYGWQKDRAEREINEFLDSKDRDLVGTKP